MTLTTIQINGVDYQSYASVNEADNYLAVDPTRAAAWAALNDDQKGANLVAATRRMDLLDWSGEKTDPAQTTDWPRTGATCDGTAIPDDEIPQQLEDGTILTAGSITLDPGAANAGTSGSNIKKVEAGSTSVEFFRPQDGVGFQDETAFSLVSCLLAGAAAGAGAGFGCASGTDGTSQFLDQNAPGLNRGYP